MKLVVLKKKFLLLIALIVAIAVITPITISTTGVFAKEKRLLPIYSVETKEKKVSI